MEEVKHYQVNGRYKVQFERSAVKGQDGFKVEASGDSLDEVKQDAQTLLIYAQEKTQFMDSINVKIPKEVKSA